MVLSQNLGFRNLAFYKLCTGLEITSLWYMPHLKDDMLAPLTQLGSLNTVEFHHCPALTGRALLTLASISTLKRLIFNEANMAIQLHGSATVISEEEWRTLRNVSLEILLLDSDNLTLDFIHYVLQSFPRLQHFLMGAHILGKLERDSRGGRETDVVTFHMATDHKQAFSRHRDVYIRNLLKDQCGPMFSNSMLQKIKERSPDKGDVVDSLMAK